MRKVTPKIPDVSFLRSETNLFEDVSYDVSIQNTAYATYYPLHSVDSKTSPIIFTISGNDLQYLNLNESKLEVRGKIVKNDGSDVAFENDKAVAAYAPINNFLHSMFKNVTLHVNDVEVTSKSGYYPYRAYIETVLAKGKDYRKSQANAALFYKTKNEESVLDEGWVTRMRIVDRSASFEMIGRPHVDLLQQIKLIPPGVDIKLTLHRSEDIFMIQSVGTAAVPDLQFKVEEAMFHIVKHTILPSVMVAQLKKWESGTPVSYPMREVQMKSYTLPSGTLSHYNENCISGFLPDRIVLGLVDARHVHGTYASNPLVFKDFGLSNITITCNSEEITTFSLDMDFAANKYVRAYSALFEGLGLSDCDSGIDMTLSEFKSSKAMFVFDLRHLRNAFCPARHGNVVVNLKFKAAIAQAITVMCYLEYQSVLYIDSDRQVYFKDFSKNY